MPHFCPLPPFLKKSKKEILEGKREKKKIFVNASHRAMTSSVTAAAAAMSSAVRYARMQPQMMMKQQQKRRRMSYLKLVSSSRARARVRARATAEEEEEREMFRERIFNDGIVSTGRLSSPTREYESETLCPMVLSQWRSANAVCFDIDCTVCKNDSMDALAAFLGKSDEVKYWTDKAMEGHVDLEHSLEERMKIIDPTPDDIQAYLKACPAEERLNHVSHPHHSSFFFLLPSHMLTFVSSSIDTIELN